MTTPPTIDAVGVTRHYGEVAALRGVPLRVAPGVAYGLVGPNGAGKSTLLRILCGLSTPDAGSVRLGGSDPFRAPREAKRLLGCMPEVPPLFELLTGVEQLAWVGRLHGLSEQVLEERVQELGAMLDLTEALGRRISTYSHGMRQKLAFAAAIVHDPRMLVLDEPFEGVDVLVVRSMKAAIRQFVDAGAAVILSSHILPLVEDVCERFGIIADGLVVFEGDRDAVAAEGQRLAAGSAGQGRALESVFLSVVAADPSVPSLKTLAQTRGDG